MLLHDAVKKARQELGLSQQRLAELAGIQRKQLSTLESGGNITLATLRKVLAHLPNIESFTLDAGTPTVMRQAPTADQQKTIEAALGVLNDAIRGFAKKLYAGQIPDEEDLQALEKASEQWDRDVGDDEDLLALRANQETALVLQFAAYRGGARAALDSIIALDQRRRAARRKRLAKLQHALGRPGERS